MKKLHFSLLFLLTYIVINGQEFLGQIPDSLILNSKSVIISHYEKLEIFNKSKISHTESSNTLILNEKENPTCEVTIVYDLFTKVDEIILEIYSLDGKKIKTIKKKEFHDYAYQDGYTVASDTRILHYHIKGFRPPYLIKKEIKYTLLQSFQIPKFVFIDGPEISILHSKYEIVNNDTSNILKIDQNIHFLPKIQAFHKDQRYTYILENVKGYKLADFITDDQHPVYIQPILQLFQMDNQEGSLESWATFGVWIDKLVNQSGRLSEKSASEIRNLIGKDTDKKTILHKLYTYLQQNTRYVSVQLGIGGFRPMPVQQVHDFKYGDCKALTNYMKSILEIAEIDSKYVIINAGSDHKSPNPGMVKNIFNHALLAAIIEEDTIFLECVSTINPPGYLGNFTGNRTAFMIDGMQSKLVQTPNYDYTENKISNHYEIMPDTKKVINTTFLTGVGIEHKNINYLINASDDKLSKHLTKANGDQTEINIISKNTFTNHQNPNIFLKTTFTLQNNALSSGTRYILQLQLDKIDHNTIFEIDNKETSLKIKNGFTISDTFNIEIPVGCFIEKKPVVTMYDSEAGNIQLETLDINTSSISILKKVIFKKGEYLLNLENPTQLFLKAYKKLQTEKIVINCKS